MLECQQSSIEIQDKGYIQWIVEHKTKKALGSLVALRIAIPACAQMYFM
jgi:hypothetical protein